MVNVVELRFFIEKLLKKRKKKKIRPMIDLILRHVRCFEKFQRGICRHIGIAFFHSETYFLKLLSYVNVLISVRTSTLNCTFNFNFMK